MENIPELTPQEQLKSYANWQYRVDMTENKPSMYGLTPDDIAYNSWLEENAQGQDSHGSNLIDKIAQEAEQERLEKMRPMANLGMRVKTGLSTGEEAAYYYTLKEGDERQKEAAKKPESEPTDNVEELYHSLSQSLFDGQVALKDKKTNDQLAAYQSGKTLLGKLAEHGNWDELNKARQLVKFEQGIGISTPEGQKAALLVHEANRSAKPDPEPTIADNAESVVEPETSPDSPEVHEVSAEEPQVEPEEKFPEQKKGEEIVDLYDFIDETIEHAKNSLEVSKDIDEFNEAREFAAKAINRIAFHNKWDQDEAQKRAAEVDKVFEEMLGSQSVEPSEPQTKQAESDEVKIDAEEVKELDEEDVAKTIENSRATIVEAYKKGDKESIAYETAIVENLLKQKINDQKEAEKAKRFEDGGKWNDTDDERWSKEVENQMNRFINEILTTHDQEKAKSVKTGKNKTPKPPKTPGRFKKPLSNVQKSLITLAAAPARTTTKTLKSTQKLGRTLRRAAIEVTEEIKKNDARIKAEEKLASK